MFSRIRGWLVKDTGSAAVEFALVGLPFITMLVGIVEMTLFFATGVVLEGAAADAARMIRTGQVQVSTDPVTTFENALCDNVGMLISCDDLEYEVLTVPNDSFSNAESMAPKFDADGNLISGGFTPGGSSDDVLVRVVYQYQFLIPFMGTLAGGSVTSNHGTLMSTLVIKNEPYKFGD